MKTIRFLSNVFTKNSAIRDSYDFEFLEEKYETTYLKELAIETCANFIARSISQTDFRYMKDKKRLKNDWHKMLNVRPNKDESASDFWQSVTNKLIRDNEVLIIPYENQFLIAESFYRKEYALYPDTFENVTVKNFTFTEKVWNMDDIIYLTYNNERLNKFIDKLNEDYADLFKSFVSASKRAYQVRGSFSFEGAQSLDDEETKKQQSFIDNVVSAVRNSVTAIFPLLRGVTYTEYSKGDVRGPNIDDISKIKRAMIDDVANILGIPVNLIHGDVADLESTMKAYLKFCINPLIKKIQDELNAKIKMATNEQIVCRGITQSDAVSNATAIDKLVSSGAFSRNEVREMFGYERVEDKDLDEFIITKNYQSTDDLKGGDK